MRQSSSHMVQYWVCSCLDKMAQAAPRRPPTQFAQTGTVCSDSWCIRRRILCWLNKVKPYKPLSRSFSP